jgi:hypothetical protein
MMSPLEVIKPKAEIQKYFRSFLVQTKTWLKPFWFFLTIGQMGLEMG